MSEIKEKYKYLSKNIGLFALSGFIPKAMSFFLVPLYTSILSTSDYGIADLITTTVMLLVPVASLDIQDAAMRFALDKNSENKAVFTVGMKTLLAGTSFVSVGLFLISRLGIPGFNTEYLFFTAMMFFVTAGYNVFSLFCRGIDEVKTVAVSSIVNATITLSCNVVFLIVFRWGLTGYLLANTVGSFFAMAYLFFAARLYHYIEIATDPSVRADMYRYSLPLVFSVTAWWVNSASDRYILSWICGIGVSGIYAVAYKIPSILSMFGNIFAQAWSISAIREFDVNDEDRFFGRTFEIMSIAMALTCSLIMIINIPIASFLYAKGFFAAWRYVPPLLLSVVFDVLCQFIGGLFTATNDTKTLSYTTISGAAVNIVLNFTLIPFLNGMGAAVATMIGYGGVLVSRVIALKRHIKMNVNWSKILLSYALLLLQITIAEFGIKFTFLQLVILVGIAILNKAELGKITRLLGGAISARV